MRESRNTISILINIYLIYALGKKAQKNDINIAKKGLTLSNKS